MLMNQPRAQALMSKDNLAALVATAPENVTYTSGFWAMSQWIRRGPQAYAMHPAPGFGEPCLITTTGALDLVADQSPAVTTVQRYGFFVVEIDAAGSLDPVQERLRGLLAQEDDGDAVAALVKALRARGLDGARVGIDEYGIPPAYLAKVREALPSTTFVPAWEIFRQIRAIKTPEEVARLRGSAQIAEKSIAAALAVARPGASELDLAAAFHTTTIREGASPVLGASGPGRAAPCPTRSRRTGGWRPATSSASTSAGATGTIAPTSPASPPWASPRPR